MNYSEYIDIVNADKYANGYEHNEYIPFWHYTWSYIKWLRRVEYLYGKRYLWKILYYFSLVRLKQIGVKTGLSIPRGTFEKGLTLHHYGSIVVNESVHAGKYVTLQSDINISGNVCIKDNVYIAPGAKILEGVTIAEGVIIGANAVVTRDILEPYTTWAGVPARKISDKGYVDRN